MATNNGGDFSCKQVGAVRGRTVTPPHPPHTSGAPQYPDNRGINRTDQGPPHPDNGGDLRVLN